MTALRSIVVAGGGHGGFQAAASLRQEGYEGALALVCDEPGLPYQRPPLSKGYLLGQVSAEALAFRPETFFAENRIDLVPGRLAAIDRTNRRARLASGEAVAYDHLVLALGSHGRALPVPGADLDGMLGLRSLADADAIAARLPSAFSCVVVGAGFIGLEFAAVARALGHEVHVLDLADRPMSRALSGEMAELFGRAHRMAGIGLEFRQGLARIEGRAGCVAAVETTGGRRLPADLVVVGIGVVPNTAVAAEAGLEVENGIAVDRTLLTRDPAISAIGDCASFPFGPAGERVRLESVQNAVDQAKAVAARLMGRPSPYAAVPWFWSDQGSLKLQIAGLSAGHDATVTLGDDGEGAPASVLCFRAGTLVAVEAVNRPGDYMAARRLLGRTSPGLSPEQAAAPGFDLKAWESATR